MQPITNQKTSTKLNNGGGKGKQRELEEEDLEEGGLDGRKGEEGSEEAGSDNKGGDEEKRGSNKEVGKSEKDEEGEAKKEDGDDEEKDELDGDDKKEGELEDKKYTKIKSTLPMKNASEMGLGKQKDIPGRPHCFISSYFFLIFHLCHFVERTCSSNTKKGSEETTAHGNACYRCLESGMVCVRTKLEGPCNLCKQQKKKCESLTDNPIPRNVKKRKTIPFPKQAFQKSTTTATTSTTTTTATTATITAVGGICRP